MEAPSVTEKVPAWQLKHAASPDAILYLPATHAVHDPPSGPIYPGLQVQLVEVVLANGESEFAGQVTHCHVAENEPAKNNERKKRVSKRESAHQHTQERTRTREGETEMRTQSDHVPHHIPTFKQKAGERETHHKQCIPLALDSRHFVD